MSSTVDLLHALHDSERSASEAVRRAIPGVAAAVDAIAPRFEAGGRLVYAGAGTSGRLGALDAAELPPTFGTEPSRVVALLAGGPDAMWRAVEGAEDDEEAARRDLQDLPLRAGDVLVGIAASGRTPYVLAAVARARELGVLTIALTTTAGTPLEAACDLAIVAEVGPEVLAGSTRLAAGSAQKALLNMLSTGLMARCGLVHRGEMVAMRPTNRKLRVRAVRIASDLLACLPAEAERLLVESQWHLPTALVMGRFGLDPERARLHLASRSGNVARALEESP